MPSPSKQIFPLHPLCMCILFSLSQASALPSSFLPDDLSKTNSHHDDIMHLSFPRSSEDALVEAVAQYLTRPVRGRSLDAELINAGRKTLDVIAEHETEGRHRRKRGGPWQYSRPIKNRPKNMPRWGEKRASPSYLDTPFGLLSRSSSIGVSRPFSLGDSDDEEEDGFHDWRSNYDDGEETENDENDDDIRDILSNDRLGSSKMAEEVSLLELLQPPPPPASIEFGVGTDHGMQGQGGDQTKGEKLMGERVSKKNERPKKKNRMRTVFRYG